VLRKVLWWLAVGRRRSLRPRPVPRLHRRFAAGRDLRLPDLGAPRLKIADHAGGEPTDPDRVDREVQDAEKANVVALAQRLFPLASDRVLESTVCLYTMTPDHDFVVDRHPTHPNVV
jgi:glycine/D-amino acid oxidase-like deaminating enzyme